MAAGTDSYVPKDKEKKYYHVQLEKPLYSKLTGEKLSKPFTAKLSRKGYRLLVSKKGEKDKSNAEMLGYTVKVLWEPGMANA